MHLLYCDETNLEKREDDFFVYGGLVMSSDSAINQLSYNFNDFLSCSKDYGLVLIDRFTDAQIDSHLREKFSIGITGLPYSPRVRLRRILGFHYAAIGQSHFGSVIDIVLGTLRFSVNAFCRNDLEKMARSRYLLAMLAPLLQKTPYVGERGPLTTKLSLDFTPKTIKAPMYKQRYEALRDYLAQNGIIAEQVIR